MIVERPVGRRFSDVYREKAEPIPDSAKLRRRIAYKLHAAITDWEIVSTLRAETGHYVVNGWTSHKWNDFVANLSLDELLDFLTDVAQAFSSNSCDNEFIDWVTFCQRALDDENISFEIDRYGGVHYRVDQAFQNSKLAALGALNGTDNATARQAFEEAHAALSSTAGDTLTAVRRAFDAVENLFKMRFGTSRLGASEIRKELKQIGDLSGTRSGDAARRLNEAFSEWVNACHQYRHAPGEDDPTPPPRWLAVALVDGASTYLRYLTASNP